MRAGILAAPVPAVYYDIYIFRQTKAITVKKQNRVAVIPSELQKP